MPPSEFYEHNPDPPPSHTILVPELLRLLKQLNPAKRPIFEIGAGNGQITKAVAEQGYSVRGIELSPDGVEYARRLGLDIQAGSAYDDLVSTYGTYDFVYALEVIEHLYSPRKFVASAHALLQPGGQLILSTPFHGYWKNLLLALTGKMESHFTALWDHGHIKFWSKRSLSQLLVEGGFHNIRFSYVGRPYPIPKSFFVCATRD